MILIRIIQFLLDRLDKCPAKCLAAGYTKGCSFCDISISRQGNNEHYNQTF